MSGLRTYIVEASDGQPTIVYRSDAEYIAELEQALAAAEARIEAVYEVCADQEVIWVEGQEPIDDPFDVIAVSDVLAALTGEADDG